VALLKSSKEKQNDPARQFRFPQVNNDRSTRRDGLQNRTARGVLTMRSFRPGFESPRLPSPKNFRTKFRKLGKRKEQTTVNENLDGN
jgi:hypothetical protein